MSQALPILILGAALLVGCDGSGSLAGTWTYDGSGKGDEDTLVITLDASGSATSAAIGNSPCSGTITDLGQRWTATGATLTVKAWTSCSGKMTCAEDGIVTTESCSSGSLMVSSTVDGESDGPSTTTPPMSETCGYSVTDDTLTLSDCVSTPDSGVSNVGVSQVFTRSGS